MKISRVARRFGAAIGSVLLGAVMVAGPAAAGGGPSATVSPDPLVRGGDVTITFSCPGGFNAYEINMYGQPSNNSVTPSGSLDQAGNGQAVVSLDFLDSADTAVVIVASCTGEGTNQVIEDTFQLVDPPTTTVAPPTVSPATEAASVAPAAEPTELPRTGTDAAPLAAIAFLSLAIGVGLVWRARLHRV